MSEEGSLKPTRECWAFPALHRWCFTLGGHIISSTSWKEDRFSQPSDVVMFMGKLIIKVGWPYPWHWVSALCHHQEGFCVA